MDPVSKAQSANTQESRLVRFGDKIRPPWKPGESGNPKGRPRKTVFTELYEEIMADPECREKVKQQMFKTMSSKGMAGVLERREGAERVEGKVATVVDMNLSGTVTLETVLEARKKAGVLEPEPAG